MRDQFSYYSTSILKSMCTVEGYTEKMFHKTHPTFEKVFWKAHDYKDVTVLRRLNEAINKIIDDAKNGHEILTEK